MTEYSLRKTIILLIVAGVLSLFGCGRCIAQQDAHAGLGNDSSALLNQVIAVNQIKETDSAIKRLQEIAQQSIAIKCNHVTARAFMNIGERYFDAGKFARGMDFAKLALPYCTALIDKAEYYNHMGGGYMYQGDYVKASDNFFNALNLHKQMNPGREPSFLLNNLAEVNLRLGRYDKALYYYNLCEIAAAAEKNKHMLFNVPLNKAEFYITIHQYDSAAVYVNKNIDFVNKLKLSEDAKAPAYELMGRNLIKRGKYKEAVEYLQLAMRLAKNKREYVITSASFDLGEALFHQGAYAEAEATLVAALKKARSGGLFDNTISAYQTLIQIYKATGQFERGMNYMDSVAVLKDSITSAEKARTVDQMDVKFRTAEKDKLIAQNQLQIARQKNNIAQKNILIICIGGGVLVLLLVATGYYRNSRHKIKSLEQEYKIGVLKAAVRGEDNERGRIARELHDGIGGLLSAALMRFSTLDIDNEPKNQRATYTEAMNILGKMGSEIRKTAHNLMPDVLLKQTLDEAVRLYCNNIQQGGSLQIDYQSYGCFDRLTEDLKLNVYRIVQELLSNIMQHAHASHVFVQLLVNGNILAVTVEDNGTGFNIDEKKDGLGLHNIQTRVSSFDGRFGIESEAGKGTSVSVEFDLQKRV